MSTTAVAEKDLPLIPKPTIINAPADLESAILRIMEIEMALGDLVRACEIATITGQFNIIDGFINTATTTLVNQIKIEQPVDQDFKLTIISGPDTPDAETK